MRCLILLALGANLLGCAADAITDPEATLDDGEAAIHGVTTHPPATPRDLNTRPASDATGGSSNVSVWPTSSTMSGAIGEATPSVPPDQSLVKTPIGGGSGWFTVGFGLTGGYEVGQLTLRVQHSVANGATAGNVVVALLYDNVEIARSASIASTTAWTTSPVTFPRGAMSADIRDASRLQVRFYLNNSTAGGAGNIRVAWSDMDVWKLKPLIRGAITTGFSLPNYASVPASVNYAAYNIAWSDLEPDASGDQHFTGSNWAGPGWTRLENAVALATTSPSLHGIRLRVFAGPQAPRFIKRLAGCPATGSYCSSEGGVHVYDAHNGNNHCVPCFWQTNYMVQYEELMREIARRFDGRDGLHDVVDSACMSTFAEPFVRGHRDIATNDRLIQAGYTYDGDVRCHEAALDIHDADFIRTRTSIALNPWDEPCSPSRDPSCPSDHAYHRFVDTASFVLDEPYGRLEMGRKLIVQANHLNWALRCWGTGDSYSSDSCLVRNEAGPKGYQSTNIELLCSNGNSTCNTYSIIIGGVQQGLKGALMNVDPMDGWFFEISTSFNWGSVNVSDFNLRDATIEANVN